MMIAGVLAFKIYLDDANVHNYMYILYIDVDDWHNLRPRDNVIILIKRYVFLLQSQFERALRLSFWMYLYNDV